MRRRSEVQLRSVKWTPHLQLRTVTVTSVYLTWFFNTWAIIRTLERDQAHGASRDNVATIYAVARFGGNSISDRERDVHATRPQFRQEFDVAR